MVSTKLAPAARRRLRALAAEVISAPDLEAAESLVTDEASAVLGVSVAIERRPAEGVLPVSAQPEPSPPGPVADADSTEVPLGVHDGCSWTLVVGGVLEARRDAAVVEEFARLTAAALAAPAVRGAAARSDSILASAYTFARRLTRLRGTEPLPQFIVDNLAEIAQADLGALATYDVPAGELRIAATHGYPAVLVEHVRVQPGQGVLGRVLDTRRPMLVTDLDRVEGLHTRRPRYRTGSFIAVPLLANGDVLAVASLADRRDGRPFDRADLTAVRALAAPAALALVNDRLAAEVRDLAHAATIDPLTGLFNRRYFQTRIEEELERARRYHHDLALIIADIDDFKALNDQFGHLAGDHLLKQVADILKRSVRLFDVCTRYGGEEFAILMPRSDVTNGLMVAERIRQRVEHAAAEDGRLPARARVTLSLGLAVLEDDTAPTSLIARADRALYRAKADGKNCVRVAQ